MRPSPVASPLRVRLPRLAALLPLLLLLGAPNIPSLQANGPTSAIVVEPAAGPGPVIGIPAGAFSTRVLLDTTEVIQGWSYGICNDPSIVEPVAETNGSTTNTVNNGGPPAFIQTSLDPDGVTSGVVIDLLGANTLPPGSGYELQLVDYEFAASLPTPAVGDPDLTFTVGFCDTLGTPPVATVVVVGGASLIPSQLGFEIVIPAPAECEFDCVGGVDSVSLSWSDCNPGGPADYFMIFRDGVLIALVDDGSLAFEDTGLGAGVFHYELLAVSFPDPSGAPSILQGSCDAQVVPVTVVGVTPAVGPYQGGTLLIVTGTGFVAAPDTTVLIGGLEALDVTIVNDRTITCFSPGVDSVGEVDVVVSNGAGSETLASGFLYGFIRGQASSDQSLDIGDAIFILDYLFGGGPTPFCLDAADANDSAAIDIGDPIFLLNYLFTGGAPPPPPFAEPGLDLTADPYGCGIPAP